MSCDFSLAYSHATSFSLEVKSRNERVELGDLSVKEFNTVVGHCNVRRKAVGPFHAVLYPVRTNSGREFSKDFFLPTVFNQALKLNNLVVKIFAVIGAILFDVVTFPLRLLTCVPRAIANELEEEHPLHGYLRLRGQSEVLDDSFVTVRLIQNSDWQKTDVYFRDFPAPFLYSPRMDSSV